MKIYLASSWRNADQPAVLAALRAAGHEVYDFRNPAPGNTGFGWRQIDPDFHANQITAERMRETLAHPIAQAGFDLDSGAMIAADACVLLLPCGLSAHLEAGWIGGRGKRVVVLAPTIKEPELMYKLFDFDARPVIKRKSRDPNQAFDVEFGEPRPFTPIVSTVEEAISILRGVAVTP